MVCQATIQKDGCRQQTVKRLRAKIWILLPRYGIVLSDSECFMPHNFKAAYFVQHAKDSQRDTNKTKKTLITFVDEIELQKLSLNKDIHIILLY